MGTKFCMSYSCGKDSALALHRAVARGYEPVALVVTVNDDVGRSWFHGVGAELLREVSASLRIPLIEARCGGDDYEAAFEAALRKAKAMGVAACAFGDIDITGHRAWDEARCEAAGISAILPLWGENRLGVTQELVSAGFKACITTVSKQHGMSREFLGQTLTMDVIQSIAALGLDPCGENGEYHTFCYDGPLFAAPVKTRALGVHESEYAYSLHLEPEEREA